MIHNQRDLILVKDIFLLKFLHFMNRHRGSNIVPQNQIQFCFNELSGLYFIQSGSSSQNFLCHCHTHGSYLL